SACTGGAGGEHADGGARMPALADVLGSHAQTDPRPDLVARGRGREEIAAAYIATQLGDGDERGQHDRADMQHAGAMQVIELEALHLRAVRERRMRRAEPFIRSPHRARRALIDAGERPAQYPAPLELGAEERAAERIEDEELQPLAHRGRHIFVAQPGDELGEPARIGVRHSARMPAARTTFPTRASSRLRCAANSSGVLPMTTAPSAARRFATSGCASALTIAPCSRSMISRGVPAGAMIPYQEPAS